MKDVKYAICRIKVLEEFWC